MDQKWRNMFLHYSKTSVFQKSVTDAQRIITAAFYEHHKPYVAFSGGKDSTVVLYMVMQRYPETMVHHWDYGIYMPRELELEVVENAAKIGCKIMRVETSDKYQKGGIQMPGAGKPGKQKRGRGRGKRYEETRKYKRGSGGIFLRGNF